MTTEIHPNAFVKSVRQQRFEKMRPHVKEALEKGDLQGVLDGLTGKQLAFCEEYLVDLNARQAVLRVYKTKNPDEMSKQLMGNPAIKFAIDGLKTLRAEKSDVTSDYVLKEVMTIIENTKIGNPNAAMRGLELLAKHLGMLKDRTEISGPDGGAIAYEQKVKEDSASLESAIARLVTRGREGAVAPVPNTGTEG
jgi:phage terminase small subunit